MVARELIELKTHLWSVTMESMIELIITHGQVKGWRRDEIILKEIQYHRVIKLGRHLQEEQEKQEKVNYTVN